MYIGLVKCDVYCIQTNGRLTKCCVRQKQFRKFMSSDIILLQLILSFRKFRESKCVQKLGWRIYFKRTQNIIMLW